MNPKALLRAREIAAEHRKTLVENRVTKPKNEGAATTRGSLYIYAPIGDSFWGDSVSAQSVVDKLDALQKEGCTALDVFINSEGGSVWDGKAIYEAINRFKGEKVVHIDGLAASAASFIAMVGDKIVCAPSATIMIHEAASFAWGNAADLRATADVLEMESTSIAGIYAKRTKQPLADVQKMMADETWMNAEKAKQLGFCDEIRGDDDEEVDDTGAENANLTPLLAMVASTQRAVSAANKARLEAIAAKLPKTDLKKPAPASPGGERSGLPARK